MAALPSSLCPSLHRPENEKSEVKRRSASFHPNLWGDQFINNYNHDQKVLRPTLGQRIRRTPIIFQRRIWIYQRRSSSLDLWILILLKVDLWTKRAEQLKKEVKEMLKISKDPLQEMNLIDILQRLGVAHYFNKEIEESLQKLYMSYNDIASDDLYLVALQFRLLRQQGCNVSSDVFRKFQDSEGNFKETLITNVEGLLSLYEASHLSIQGEDLLDHSMKFTSTHLTAMMANLNFPLSKKVEYALEIPLRKCLQRIEARRYIPIYQNENARSEVILELAKLDFNLLQSLHQREIRELSMWERETNLPSKLPFARDRLVEGYFWILGVYYEEQYSRGRMIMTKIINLVSYMDDIYDVYGTLDELQLLTDAIQRWDIAAVDQLPKYMKDYFLELLKTVDKILDQLAPEEKTYRMIPLKEVMKEVSRAYFAEAKWYYEGHVPSFEEYMNNALITSGYPLLSVVSLVGMGKVATKEAFDWFMEKPKLIMATAMFGRVVDDIQSTTREQTTGQVVSAIGCYMKEHGVSEQEAKEKLQEMAVNTWKDVNKECLKPTPFDMPIIERPLNLTRVIELLYKYEDGYTDSKGKTKEMITSFLIDPIPT